MAALKNPSTMTSNQSPNQIKEFKYITSNELGPVVYYHDYNNSLLSISLADIGMSDQLPFMEWVKETTCFEDIGHIIRYNNQMIDTDNLSERSIYIKLQQKETDNDGIIVLTYDNIMTGHSVENFLISLKQQLLSKSNSSFDFTEVNDNFVIFFLSKMRKQIYTTCL